MIAPPNETGRQQSCTITVTATRGTSTATNSYVQIVDPAADYVTITSGPSGTPLPVESAGQVSLAVTAVDSERLFFMLTHQDGIRRLGTRAWDGALDAFRRDCAGWIDAPPS